MITQDRLKELLDYDPLTGIFRWKVSRGRVSKGSIAGTEVWVSDNYIRSEIRIDGKRYKAHQLAFLYVYGYIPEEIDHKDRNPLNNAIDNLLDSSKSRNQLNRNKNGNKELPKGVFLKHSTGRYFVQIKGKHYGYTDSIHEAETVANAVYDSLLSENTI